MLELDRPLVVLALNGTSTEVSSARALQVAMRRLEPSGEDVEVTGEVSTLVDPGVPIRSDVADRTGIANADVQGAPYFVGIMGDIDELVEGADLAGFGILEYDLPVLESEYRRESTDLPGPDDRRILDLRDLEPGDAGSLAELYEKYTGETLDNPHDADAAVEAAIAILKGQLADRKPADRSPAALAQKGSA